MKGALRAVLIKFLGGEIISAAEKEESCSVESILIESEFQYIPVTTKIQEEL
jgi:hypothetical protein